MYKDVWKRILAVAMTICLVVTFVQWPTTVKAEGTNYHIYQYGGIEKLNTVSTKIAAAIFTVNQNETQNAEILEQASFDVYVQEGADVSQMQAAISYYIEPQAGAPDTGRAISTQRIYGLAEGTNQVAFDVPEQTMEPNTTFSIVVVLEGEGVSFYANEYNGTGYTYTKQEDGTWKDMAADGWSLSVRAATYDAEEEEASLMEYVSDTLLKDPSEVEPYVVESGTEAITAGVVLPGEDTEASAETESGAAGEAGSEETEGEETGELESESAETGSEETSGTDVETEKVETGETTEPEGGETGELESESAETGSEETSGTNVEPEGGETGELESESAETGSEETSEPGSETTESKTEETGELGNEPESEETGEPESEKNAGTENVETVEPEMESTEPKNGETSESVQGTQSVFSTEETESEETDTKESESTETGENQSKGLLNRTTILGIYEDVENLFSSGAVELDWKNKTIGVGTTTSLSLNGADKDVTWESANSGIATVDKSGESQATVTGVGIGETIITATYKGNTYTCNVKVTASLQDAEIIFDPESAIYNGNQQKPSVKVMLGDSELEYRTHYFATWEYILDGESQGGINWVDEQGTAAGTYRVTIQGIDPYSGTLTKDYMINPKNIADETITITWDVDALEREIQDNPDDPDLSGCMVITDLECAGKLEAGVDYSAGDVEVNEDGQEVIVITGLGNYEGTREVAKPMSVALAEIILENEGTYVYKGTRWEPQVMVVIHERVLAPNTDYKVTYGPNVNACTVSEDEREEELEQNPDTEDVPWVTIEGIGDYFGTFTKTFAIEPKMLDNSDQDKTGTLVEVIAENAQPGQEPEITVRYNGMELTEGSDGDYEASVDKQALTYTLTGYGNYQGTVTGNYTVGTDISTLVDSLEIAGVTYTGEAQTPEVKLVDASGNEVTVLRKNVDYEVIYSNNIEVGEATVTVKGIGDYSGSVKDTFQISAISLADVNCTYTQTVMYSPILDDVKPEVTVTYQGKELVLGTDYELEYNIDDESGAYTAKEYTITVKALGSNQSYQGEKVLLYTIQACSLPDAVNAGKIRIEMENDEFSYTGEAIDPEIMLVYVSADEEKPLGEGTDYDITYSPNTIDTGKVTATIKAVSGGNYTGIVQTAFEIVGKSIEHECYIVVDDAPDKNSNLVDTYKGGMYPAMMWLSDKEEENCLAIKVIDKETGKELTQSKDYDVTYDKDSLGMSKKGSTAKITVTGKGSYTGESTYAYLLAKKLDDCTFNVTSSGKTYTGSEILLTEDELVIKPDGSSIIGSGDKMVKDVDYRISYEDNVDAGDATVTLQSMPASMLPTENGCYYMEVQGSKTGNFTIKPASIENTVLAEPIEKEYAGSAVELRNEDIKLTYQEKELIAGSDFDIDTDTYDNNNSVSEEGKNASVYVNGKNNFTGMKEIEFKITGKTFDQMEYTVEEVTYIGKGVEPEVTLWYYNSQGTPIYLKKGTDFTCTYKDNIDAGDMTATVLIQGKGEYLGAEREIKFSILPADISTAGVTVVGNDYTYTSEPLEPKVTAGIALGAAGSQTSLELKEITDYTLSYEKNTDAGDATVILQGTGNYTGAAKQTFEITPADISAANAKITVAPIPTQAAGENYTAVCPIPEITYAYADGKTYTLQADDFSCSYEDNFYEGTAEVIIEGTGNFEGTRKESFKIGIDMENADRIRIDYPELDAGEVFTYDGSKHEPKVEVWDITDEDNPKKLKKDTHYEIKYGDDDGILNNTDAGETGIIYVTGLDRYGGTATKTFTIQPRNILNDKIELKLGELGNEVSDGSYAVEYTGSPITLGSVVVTDNGINGGVVLTEADYTVGYGKDNFTDCGEIPVIIRGQGNYTGEITIENSTAAKFTITPRTIGYGTAFTASGISYDRIAPQALDDGKAEPIPTLYCEGKPLVNGQDFICSYENNTKVGEEAFLIVTGIGNYTGTLKISFVIRDHIKNADITGIPEKVYYKDYLKDDGTCVVDLTDKIKVVHKNGAIGELVNGQDYTITQENNQDVGVMTVTLKGTRNGRVAGEITYNVKIVADLTEKDDAGKNVTEVLIEPQEYTGSELKPEPVVTYRGKTLQKGVDYVIGEYKNNVNITKETKATVRIVGTGCYEGSITAEFEITAVKGGFMVRGCDDSYKYRGSAIEPTIWVLDETGSNLLEKDTDYTVSYANQTNVGTATITIVGTADGNYSECSTTIQFEILPITMDELKVSEIKDCEYTGEPVLPDVSLQLTTGGKNYTITKDTGAFSIEAKAGANNVEVGQGTVTLVGDGVNITGSKDVNFTITGRSINTDEFKIVVHEGIYEYNGSAHTPAVTVQQYFAEGGWIGDLTPSTDGGVTGDYTVSYSNNINAGTATVTVTGINNYRDAKTAEFTIAPYDFTHDPNVVIELPDGDTYKYVGNQTGATPRVRVTKDGVPMDESAAGVVGDYELAYGDNTGITNAAKVIIKGTGNYTGQKVKTFAITRHDINDDDVTKGLPIPNQSYTGKPVSPEVEMTCDNGYQLKKGTDYELDFKGADHTQLGMVKVTIRGIGGFTGEIETEFKIASGVENADVIGLKSEITFTGSQIPLTGLGITKVMIGNKELGTDSYTLEYADGSDGTNVGTQYVILRGIGEYGGTKKLNFKITAKNISDKDVVLSGLVDNIPFGQVIEQNITLTWGDIVLVEGEDYTADCVQTNTSGIYKLVVTGKKNYTGTIEKEFHVEQRDLASANVTGISSLYTYSGNAITPKPTVEINGIELKEGVDYTIAYKNNMNAGKGIMILTGKGDYSGEKEVLFNIVSKKINMASFGEIPTQVYTGRDVTPTVTVTDNGKNLSLLTDYNLLYSNNRKAGTGAATVAGIGNYTGTKTLRFSIRPGGIGNIGITAASASSITLSWKLADAQAAVTGYEIYRAGEDGKYTMIARKKASTFMDETMPSAGSYTYKVRAYLVIENGTSGNDTYYGNFSDIIEGTI